MKRKLAWAGAAVLPACLLSLPASAQDIPDLSGMWSDPPPRAEDAFCHVGCPVESRDHLTRLLDDPDNLDKTYAELNREARRYQGAELVPSYLTAAALANYPFDNSADPSLTACEPWGFTRQILSPHAMELTQYDDRVTLYYSEWTALRTVYLDGREPPRDLEHSLLGYSVGHYEGDTLVVETVGVTADHSNSGFAHSDQLTSTERFTRSADGERLDVEATFADPLTLTRPLVMARAWAWAPTEEIYPYEDCVVP
ncbi:MAG: hypothetical protein ACJ0SL_07055 [Candidatus Rariloculaceae bacterium]